MEVRSGLYVVWCGKEYRADPDGKHHFILYSKDFGDEALGFERSGTHAWRKRVGGSEISEAYNVSPRARYKGHVYSIGHFNDGLLLLGTGHHPPDDHGFERTDPGFYEKWVPITEVDETWEEKRPFKWS